MLTMRFPYRSQVERTKTVDKANNFHSTIKYTAEMSETEITFLDAKVYKGIRFNKKPIPDVQTYHKPTRRPGANRSLSHVNHQA